MEHIVLVAVAVIILSYFANRLSLNIKEGFCIHGEYRMTCSRCIDSIGKFKTHYRWDQFKHHRRWIDTPYLYNVTIKK